MSAEIGCRPANLTPIQYNTGHQKIDSVFNAQKTPVYDFGKHRSRGFPRILSQSSKYENNATLKMRWLSQNRL